MFLKKLEIIKWGKLKNISLTFSENKLNILNFPNEWGKSTLFMCILALFYGVEKNSKNFSTPQQRSHYLPWTDDAMEAKLFFNFAEENYYLYRKFGEKSKDDRLHFVNETTQETITLKNKQEVGEYLFSLNKESFLSIIIFGHEGANNNFSKKDNQELKDKLNSLGTKLDGQLSYVKASTALENYQKSLYSPYTQNSLKKILDKKEFFINNSLENLKFKTEQNIEAKNKLLNEERFLLENKENILKAKQQLAIFEKKARQKEDIKNKWIDLQKEKDEKSQLFQQKIDNLSLIINDTKKEENLVEKELNEIKKNQELKKHLSFNLDLLLKQKNILISDNDDLHQKIKSLTEKETLAKEELKKIEEEYLTKKLNLSTTNFKENKLHNYALPFLSSTLFFSFLSIFIFLFSFFTLAYITISLFIISLSLTIYIFILKNQVQKKLLLKDEENQKQEAIYNSLKQDKVDFLTYLQNEKEILLEKDKIQFQRLKEIEDEHTQLSVRISELKDDEHEQIKNKEEYLNAQLIILKENLSRYENELKKLISEKQTTENYYINFEQNLERNQRVLDLETPLPPFTAKEIEDKLLSNTISLTTIKHNLKNLANEVIDYYPLEELKEDLISDKLAVEKENEAVLCAIKVLEDIKREIKKEWAPSLLKETGKILKDISDGKYEEVQIKQDFTLAIFDAEVHQFINMNFLSQGTLEQIYLAMRLALLRILEPQTSFFPLFLDDPFVHYDNLREYRTFKVIIEKEIAQNKRFVFCSLSKSSVALLKIQENFSDYLHFVLENEKDRS